MAYGRRYSIEGDVSADKMYFKPSIYDISSGAEVADKYIDLGLQVLDNVIMTRWKVLPRDQCQGMYSSHVVVLPRWLR